MKILLSILFIYTTHSWSSDDHNFISLKENQEIERKIVFEPENYDSLNKLTVNVHMRNFKSKDRKKVAIAIKILEVVMNSEEFKKRVLNHKWMGVKRFNNNNGLSNLEIYQHLMTGQEIMMPDTPGVMNFDLSLYRSWNPFSKVKGYTLPDTMRIWIHKKFFRRKSWSTIDTAANMAHEWVHKMGYGHSYKHNLDRPYTVPYAVGNIVSQIAESMKLDSRILL